jgi:uncharacterized protein involved in exopolysaccharide biosynthesis
MKPEPSNSPLDLLRLVGRHPWRLAFVAVLVAAGAATYAFLQPQQWEASQPLVIRNVASNPQSEGPGKFPNMDSMKAIQETVVELAKSPPVLEAALARVGPPADCAYKATWPTRDDIEELRSTIKVQPPKGLEFGSTEIFYVSLRSNTRDRAVALVNALGDQLEANYQKLRDQKSTSMIEELVQTVAMAEQDLATAVAQLSELESKIGPDVDELRSLSDPQSSSSDVRRRILDTEVELRRAQQSKLDNENLVILLKDARDNPELAIVSPNRLLQSQPALEKLKSGLIAAQVRTAELRNQGGMTDRHPKVVAAESAEDELRDQLREEISTALRGVESDLSNSDAHVAALSAETKQLKDHLVNLVSLRAEYISRNKRVEVCHELIRESQRNLADARASQLGAQTSSLITRVHVPDIGENPIGPSKAVIILAGIAGGLAAGFGFVLLTAPMTPAPTQAAGSIRRAESPLESLRSVRRTPRYDLREAREHVTAS